MVSEKDRAKSIAMLDRVETLRQEKGVTKAEMYKAVGVTQGAFSQWRKGLTSPTAKSIRALANYFGTTEEFLMFGTEQPATTGGLTDAQKELLDLIPLMTEQEVTVLLAAAKAQEAVRRSLDAQ